MAVYKYGPHKGHRIEIGKEFGHETVSRVVAIGKKVTDFTVGERVYPYPRTATGDSRKAGMIGGFSEYIKIPNAKRDYSLYAVDESISDKTACLIEPFTVGCRAARRAKPKQNEKFVVFGCGTIGLSCAIALTYFGAEKVMICDLSDYRLDIAKQLGFETCNLTKYVFQEKAIDYFGTAAALSGETADIDGMIDASGAESIFQSFMDEGKIESRFVAVAVNNAARKLDLLHLTYSQKSIIGSGGYMPEDVKDVMNIMKSGKWDIEKMITQEFPLIELEKALKTAEDTKKSLNVTIRF